MLSILLIVACNRGGDTDTPSTPIDSECSEQERLENNGECPTGDDTGEQPIVGSGNFTAPMIDAGGVSESCTSNLISDNDDYTVASGETEEVKATAYDLTFGSMDLASEFSDFLPIHTAGDGGQWIAPGQTLEVGDGKTVTADEPTMSRYIGGQEWTCNLAGSTSSATAQTAIVSYLDDASGTLQITLPSIGTSNILVEELEFDDGDCHNSGRFLNSTQLQFHVDCSFGTIDYDCWMGQLAQRPATW